MTDSHLDVDIAIAIERLESNAALLERYCGNAISGELAALVRADIALIRERLIVTMPQPMTRPVSEVRHD